MLCKRGISRHAVSVSVRPSRLWILSKRIIVSSNFFHRRVATPFWFSHTKRHGNIPTGIPLTGEYGVGKIAILSQYLASLRAVNHSSGKCNTQLQRAMASL